MTSHTTAVTPFRQVLVFFDSIGLFDVVLPFLLVFTIVFAILEKTKVLGTEDIEGKKYTKKNLNAISAFVMAFLVVASSELVEIITTVSSQAVVVLFLSVLFLLLVGSFYKEGEPVFLEGGWKIVFMIIVFIAIIGIFLGAIKTSDGRTWLERLGDFTGTGGDELAGSLILLALIVLFIVYATKDTAKEAKHS
ncbi:hypothetical protein J4480_03905 [Candidatus Woesearchaeota archaeon]|nr:hypothetical protein [Candidatus Woesearchaeota archaeon]